MINIKTEYTHLVYLFKRARTLIKSNKDYSNELNKAVTFIDDYIKNSVNIARTAFEIESICLEYDNSINLKKNIRKIDSRLTGCLAAIRDLNELQNNSAQYVKDYLRGQPLNLKAASTYTKEVSNSSKYLSLEKNTNYTREAVYNLYEKRQEILKLGKQVYLKEKEQKIAQWK